jgi:hypothetical protein
MFNKFRIGAAGVALISAMGMAGSANAATASAFANAEILAPLVVTKTADLDFGTVAVNGAGTVTLDAADGKTCSGTLICSGGSTSAAFHIDGAALSNVTISTGSIVALTSGANSMTLSNLSISNSAFALDGTGDGDFKVGGQIAVAANQAAGSYQGSFVATVIYQ